jgi:hypothetical protein
MKQIELRLIPTPGAKPEFLAKLQLTDTSSNAHTNTIWETIPPLVVLEGYTRDAWASDTSTQWQSLQVTSVDGRQKLPGFLKYLRDRQKTAFGSFRHTASSGKKYMWVVSYKQASSQMLTCRIASVDSIPGCPVKQQQVKGNVNVKGKASDAAVPKPAPAAAPPSLAATATTTKVIRKKGSGLLGNLVGAQKRTNQHLQSIQKVQPQSSTTTTAPATTDATSNNNNNNNNNAPAAPSVEYKTSGQVLAEFRQEMEQQMLDFDISDEPMLHVKIDLAAKLKLLSQDEQQQGRVTMEILKYIVYEQAEEVNDEWIAQKKASEFLDEVVVAIYKQGQAPLDVLEDVNKGDLPDEIRGQQRAIQQQQQRLEQIREQKQDKANQQAALKAVLPSAAQGDKDGNNADNDDDDNEDHVYAALNQNKRDRRTIEEIQKLDKNSKRQRVD